MFGHENYSFSLLNMADGRFDDEAAEMSRKLMAFFYDFQIIELEWRKTYKGFIEAEKRLASLTPGVVQKSREKAEQDLVLARDQLLRLQDQRDLFERVICKIWARCTHINETIQKEKNLEKLRVELAESVKERFPPSDPFWKAKFKVRTMTGPISSHKHHRQK